jgi:hypothetical protein
MAPGEVERTAGALTLPEPSLSYIRKAQRSYTGIMSGQVMASGHGIRSGLMTLPVCHLVLDGATLRRVGGHHELTEVDAPVAVSVEDAKYLADNR